MFSVLFSVSRGKVRPYKKRAPIDHLGYMGFNSGNRIIPKKGTMRVRFLYLTCLYFLFFTPLVTAQTFEGITIEAEVDDPPYDRGLYKHWIDADADDEKTRDEVLIEESLVPVTIQLNQRGERKVIDGLWVGPYTGFVTRNPRKLQIDHMVPLKEAHISGAMNWDSQKKKDFANDLDLPQALIAVKSGANGSKGEHDPAHWMPPNRSYWCQYLEDWMSVKKKWELSVDQAEVDAIKKGRAVCNKYKSGDALEGRH